MNLLSFAFLTAVFLQLTVCLSLETTADTASTSPGWAPGGIRALLAKTGAGYFEVALIVTIIVGAVTAWQIKIRWITAGANEWLLLVENGKLVQSGIGLTVFKGLNSVVVRFPSFIQKVGFSAEQITKEVQGVRVTGFVVWSIFREGDGPLKAYRYLDGLSVAGCEKANENLARMAESIIRHQVANVTINEVITQREMMRDRCKKDMGEVVKGWGVWLETVEVTEVRICSGSLFEDLQVEFRQATKRSAERMRLETRQDIQQNELKVESEMASRKADAATISAIYAAKKKLEKDMEENKCQVEMRNKKAEADSAAAIFSSTCDLETRKKKAEAENTAEIYALSLEVESKKKKAEAQTAASIHATALESEMRMKKVTADMNTQLHTMTVDADLRNRKVDADISQATYLARKTLEQRLEEEKLAAEMNRIRAAEMKAEHERECQKLSQEIERARIAAAAKLDRDTMATKQELQLLKERLEIEKAMTPASLQRLGVESTAQIYKSLPLQQVRMVNVTNGPGSLDTMLPGLMGLGVVNSQLQPIIKE